MRPETYDKLLEIFLESAGDMNKALRLARQVEEMVFLASTKVLASSMDCRFHEVYTGLSNNLIFNLTDYSHSSSNIEKLSNDPIVEMNKILFNGPFALNADLQEIQKIIVRQQIGGSQERKLTSNTGGTVRCQRCGQFEVFRKLVQDRSGDEAMSQYLTCCNASCGYQWRMTG